MQFRQFSYCGRRSTLAGLAAAGCWLGETQTVQIHQIRHRFEVIAKLFLRHPPWLAGIGFGAFCPGVIPVAGVHVGRTTPTKSSFGNVFQPPRKILINTRSAEGRAGLPVLVQISREQEASDLSGGDARGIDAATTTKTPSTTTAIAATARCYAHKLLLPTRATGLCSPPVTVADDGAVAAPTSSLFEHLKLDATTGRWRSDFR